MSRRSAMARRSALAGARGGPDPTYRTIRSAPTASAAISAPSRTRCGRSRSRVRSFALSGSPSAPLTRTTAGPPGLPGDRAPLAPDREAGAAAPEQAAGLEGRDRVGGVGGRPAGRPAGRGGRRAIRRRRRPAGRRAVAGPSSVVPPGRLDRDRGRRCRAVTPAERGARFVSPTASRQKQALRRPRRRRSRSPRASTARSRRCRP